MEHLYGRLVVAQTLTDGEQKLAKFLPAIVNKKGRNYCGRCGSLIQPRWTLPDQRFYCRECLVFGRNTSGSPLCYFPAKPFPKTDSLRWKGQLTALQQRVSDQLLDGLNNRQPMLVHAVTGAGKTEIIYQSVAKVIDQGGQVCLASPRVDVCNELYQRLKRDFSCEISLLHGDSETYKRAPLVIATTHQLLTFYKAFDLLIIDEVDAFPFVDNDRLYHAVDQCIKADGMKIYLTATSTDALEKQVQQGQLKQLELPRRFHGNPLVEPRFIWEGTLVEQLKKNRLTRPFKRQFQQQRQSGYPLLLFFPNIDLGQRFAAVLQKAYPDERIGFVASTTPERADLIQDFRDMKLSILVTTTILERGVTFPGVDVFVLWSHHTLYTKSSLIQIGGRVGRSKERPTGKFYLFHEGVSLAMLRARFAIRVMNKRGGF